MYDQVWFDSSTERDTANIFDSADAIKYWVRLHRNDLPILWNSYGQWYNPDFIVWESDGTYWVVEVKADRDLEIADVTEKKDAALRWANHVSASEKVGATWRYLLVSESDVAAVRGSWDALKRLTS